MFQSYLHRCFLTLCILITTVQLNAQSYHFIPAPTGYNPTYSDGFPVSFNNKLYYSFQNYDDGICKLGEYDGNSVTLYTVPSNGSLQVNQGYGSVVFNNKLYFICSNQEGGSQLAVFDGSAITYISMPDNSSTVYGTPTVYNGNLYVQYNDNETNNSSIAKVNGSSLTLINNPDDGDPGLTNDYSNLTLYNGQLYLNYRTSSGNTRLAKFNGGTITLVGTNPDNGDGFTGGLFTYNGELYDVYTNESNQSQIVKVSTASFPLINNPDAGTGCNIGTGGWTPVVYNGNVYFGYTNASTKRQLAKFDGTTVTLIDNPLIETVNYNGFSGNMIVYNNNLFYINSHFSGGPPYYYLIRFDGTSSTVVSSPENGTGVTSKPVIYDNKLYFPYNYSSSVVKLGVYTSGSSFTAIDNVSGSDLGVGLLYPFNNKLYFSYRYPDFTTQLASLSPAITWTGTNSSDWNDGDNWSTGVVPTGSDDVVISNSTHNPVISSAAFANNITINAPLTINNTLSVAGNIGYNGGFTGNGTISLDGSSLQTLTGTSMAAIVNTGIGSLIINNPAGVSLDGGLKITNSVSFGNVSNSTFETNDGLTLRSSATGTANVGQLINGNAINGDVTVERYISNNAGTRAWRLLSVPTQTTQSINATWQEGQAGGSNSVHGYGTIITAGNGNNNWAANGFDYQQTTGSLYKYNAGGNGWDEVTSTYDQIKDQQGYLIYIRGDRSVTPSSSTSSATATILRTQGPLYQGDQTTTVTGGQYALIGNKYASAIDFTLLTKDAGINNSFVVWDPKLLLGGSLGHYQTFSSTTTPAWQPVPGGGSYTGSTNTRIESGQAFFVHAESTGDVTLTESSKVTGSNNVFRPTGVLGSGVNGQLITNLYSTSVSPTTKNDQNVVSFNSAFSDDIDVNDVSKFPNTTENFDDIRNGQKLWIEGRQSISATDTIFYCMNNMQQQLYVLQFIPTNLNVEGLTAVLQDRYLSKNDTLDLTQVSTKSFQIDGNAGSQDSLRFRLVFTYNPSPTPVTFTSIKAQPTTAGIQVQWNVTNETGIVQYVVQHSADGKNFTDINTESVKGNGAYASIDTDPFAGKSYYRIKAVELSGQIKYTDIVNVVTSQTPSITVYPNPVKGSTINLQLFNQPAGKYIVRLINAAGQRITTTSFNHNGGSALQQLHINVSSAGSYKLQMISNTGKTFVQTISIE
ncbi:T9SS type A sorting domain-containing protein [Ferruginibacter albus]|uniref:T9SS type A sorting domain-containing protein n=1 Tax=Ferruginibacter albus TaxID=2875540 RepID=UPI001CC5032B|nr:T9SS type A sorting domain-containing protein [Ferruginibacter albus]UAY50983.1 T9SS type A sorting domain-containing protein [Ferruginibacter albus]